MHIQYIYSMPCSVSVLSYFNITHLSLLKSLQILYFQLFTQDFNIKKQLSSNREYCKSLHFIFWKDGWDLPHSYTLCQVRCFSCFYCTVQTTNKSQMTFVRKKNIQREPQVRGLHALNPWSSSYGGFKSRVRPLSLKLTLRTCALPTALQRHFSASLLMSLFFFWGGVVKGFRKWVVYT